MYSVKLVWYDEYKDVEVTSHMMVCASSYSEAVEKATLNFRWINSIQIEEIHNDLCSVVYIPEECLNAVIEENNY